MSFDLPSFRDGTKLTTGARRGKTVGDLLKDAVRQGNMSGGHGADGLSLKIEFLGRLSDALSQRYPARGKKIRISGSDTQPSILVIADVQWVQLDSWQCRFTFTLRAARLGEGGEDVAEPADRVFEMSVGVRIEEFSQPGIVTRTAKDTGTGPDTVIKINSIETWERCWKTRSITLSEPDEPSLITGAVYDFTVPTGKTYKNMILRSYSGKPNTTSAGWVNTYELETTLSERLIREIS